jgi:hypothetical protein
MAKRRVFLSEELAKTSWVAALESDAISEVDFDAQTLHNALAQLRALRAELEKANRDFQEVESDITILQGIMVQAPHPVDTYDDMDPGYDSECSLKSVS